jgi:two-component system, response regulator PdtaR
MTKTLVLVVEDDPLQMMMTGDFVEHAGFEPLFARNAYRDSREPR